MAKEREKRGLGRGLSALMADVDLNPTETTTSPRRPEQYVPVEKIEPLLEEGQRVFGENRVQEAQYKWPE
ncbi:MAG: hypothetical protein ABGX09_19105, partial [Thioclava sp.]